MGVGDIVLFTFKARAKPSSGTLYETQERPAIVIAIDDDQVACLRVFFHSDDQVIGPPCGEWFVSAIGNVEGVRRAPHGDARLNHWSPRR